jgi:hypothetical protein
VKSEETMFGVDCTSEQAPPWNEGLRCHGKVPEETPKKKDVSGQKSVSAEGVGEAE